jgi:hydroxypyruvate isomerase
MSSPIGAAAKLGNPNPNPNLNLHGTGLDDRGLPQHPVQTVTGAMWQAAVNTLTLVSALDEREGVCSAWKTSTPPSTTSAPPFARAADTRALDQAVNSSHLRMNLDLCHAQIGAGDLIQRIRDSIDRIGEVLVADVPGRCEPGIGEINYPAIAAALHDARYTGVAGLEAWASGDSDTALQRFGDAFTPPAWIRCFGLRTLLYALLLMSVTRLRGLSMACGSCPTRDCIPCRSREHQCFDHR